jgi:hypothetical protein
MNEAARLICILMLDDMDEEGQSDTSNNKYATSIQPIQIVSFTDAAPVELLDDVNSHSYSS